MSRFKKLAVTLLLTTGFSCNTYRFTTDISENDLMYNLQNLASDSFQGRYPGTRGDSLAGQFIGDQFSRLKLNHMDQSFAFLQSVREGSRNLLEVNGHKAPAGSFGPFPFSTDTLISSGAVFAGYGLTVRADSFHWDDYQGLGIRNKWVVMLRGIPDIPEYEKYLSSSADDRDKVMQAMDSGACGVIFISGKSFDSWDHLVTVSGKPAFVGIPVIQVKRSVADGFILPDNTPVDSIECRSVRKKQPVSFPLDVMIMAGTDIDNIFGSTANHFAILDGSDPVLKNEYIVVGAHFDHLGRGGPGSSSLRPDTMNVHNGADDNASGIAAMLELAGKLNEKATRPRRSVIFAAFGAEEMGLLGSKYFVNHAPVAISQIVTMINLDMVGRLDTTKGLQISGTGTSLEADSLVRYANKSFGLKLKLTQEGSGPSDHASFYGKNIPVFFITSGVHLDYHTPLDDLERINFRGLKQITDFTLDLLQGIDNSPSRLTFRESGPKESSAPRSRFKVTLGFMPDFTATDVEGVRVDFVSKGRPAELGGIRKGDVIRAIDGMPVKNIYDYMYRLSKLHKGQIISVEIIRDNNTQVLVIQL